MKKTVVIIFTILALLGLTLCFYGCKKETLKQGSKSQTLTISGIRTCTEITVVSKQNTTTGTQSFTVKKGDYIMVQDYGFNQNMCVGAVNIIIELDGNIVYSNSCKCDVYYQTTIQ